MLNRVLFFFWFIASLYGCANKDLARPDFTSCKFPDDDWLTQHSKAREHYSVTDYEPRTAVSGQVWVQEYAENGEPEEWKKRGAPVTSSPGGWSFEDLDLTDFADKKVRKKVGIRFTHTAGNADQSSGWYINDLVLAKRASPTDLKEGFVNWSNNRRARKISDPDPSPLDCEDVKKTNEDGSQQVDKQCHQYVTLTLPEVSEIEKIHLRYKYWFYYPSINPYYSRCKYNAVQNYVGHKHGDNYSLGFIEFNDQGQLRSREQLYAVINEYEEIARKAEEAKSGVVMVVFAHGWHHGPGFKVNEDPSLSNGNDPDSRDVSLSNGNDSDPRDASPGNRNDSDPRKVNSNIISEDRDVIQFRNLLQLVAEAEHEDAKAEYQAVKAEYKAVKAGYEAVKAEYEAALAEYEAAKTENNEAVNAGYEAFKAEYEAFKADFVAALGEYEAAKTENNEAVNAGYEAVKAEYEAALAEYEAARTENKGAVVNYTRTKYEAAKEEYEVAEQEHEDAKLREPRKVLGVYLGWRGEATSFPGFNELTFWSRKKVAHKVGQQGVTESLLALENVVSRGVADDESDNGAPNDEKKNHMVIIGHSFGAAIVIGGLQKILLEKNLQAYGHVQTSKDVNMEPKFSDNFNSGRNFYENKWGDDDAWRIGPPVSDKTSCFEGKGCAYSVLGENPDSDRYLASKFIHLPPVTGNEEIHLRFQSWLPYNSPSAGRVKVIVCIKHGCEIWNDQTSTLVTSEKAPWVKEAVQAKVKGGWTLRDVNLTDYAGKYIRIGFKHIWSGSNEGESWYVDDVEIVVAKPPDNAKGFADLTVLINPAIEAIRYATLFDVSQRYDSSSRKCSGYQNTQTPNLVVLTSQEDRATKYLFPIGQYMPTLFDTHQTTDHYRCTAIGQKPPPWNFDEESANSTALGHFEDFVSHDLVAREGSLARQSIERDGTLKKSWEQQNLGDSLCFEHVKLKHLGKTDPFNPYLNISVSGEIIPDHNEIWGPELQSFLRTMIRLSTAKTDINSEPRNYNSECGITIDEKEFAN